MLTEKLTEIYLSQTEYYVSESKDEIVMIKDMHWKHALNAAKKLLRNSEGIAEDAGQTQASWSDAQIWMSRQPLFRALSEKAL